MRNRTQIISNGIIYFNKIILTLSAFFFFLLLTAILTKCTTSLSSIYASNYTLSPETIKSKISKLTVNLPVGWFAADDNECKCTDVWLVKDDYSATLNFVSINLDSLTSRTIRNNDLQPIAEFSKTFVKVKFGKAFKGFMNEESFEINGQKFLAYQFFDDQNRNIRVVIFKSANKYYELSAVPVKMSNPAELFVIQNSILTSIGK